MSTVRRLVLLTGQACGGLVFTSEVGGPIYWSGAVDTFERLIKAVRGQTDDAIARHAERLRKGA